MLRERKTLRGPESTINSTIWKKKKNLDEGDILRRQKTRRFVLVDLDNRKKMMQKEVQQQ